MKTIGLLALALCAISTSAKADWQYTKWGMSPEQVVAASKGKASLATATDIQRKKRLDREPGAVGRYLANDIEFETVFFFNQKGLDLVVLDLPATSEDPSIGPNIENQLLANYGQPSATGPLPGGGNKKTWVDAKHGNAIEFYTMRASRTYYTLFYRPAGKSGGL